MILAAAIEFEIEKTGKCVVLCGARHGDVFKQLKGLGFIPMNGYKEIEQGFIDNYGNFLTRKEAYEHAVTCGQLCANILHKHTKSGNKELMSEDLW